MKHIKFVLIGFSCITILDGRNQDQFDVQYKTEMASWVAKGFRLAVEETINKYE